MGLGSAIFLGALQGLTEFLPISSSGHLAIAQHYLPGFSQPGVLFDVTLHVGTLAALVVYFRKEIGAMILSPISPGRSNPGRVADRRFLGLIMIGLLPTVVIGLMIKDWAELLFGSVVAVSLMLLLTGSLLLATGLWRRASRGLPEMGLGDALLIGAAQGLAVMPGISRSGATISTGIFRGLEASFAARYSFLLSIPAVMGAMVLEAKGFGQVSMEGGLGIYLAGALAAFVVGLASLKVLMDLIGRGRFSAFAYYCFALGIGVLILNTWGG